MIWSVLFGFPRSLITVKSATTCSVCCLWFILILLPFSQRISLLPLHSLHAPWCVWWREMFHSSELTVAQRPHAVNRSSGNLKVTKTSCEIKCGTRDIQMVLIRLQKKLSRFCAELLRESSSGSNVFCPPVFVSTLCCCAKWLHTCSQKRSPLYSLLLYAAGQIELYQIKLFGPFCCAVGKC